MKLKQNFPILLLALLSSLALGQQSDPWPSTALLSPEQLATELKAPAPPHVIYVGFPILYKGAHIANAAFAGPCSKPEGIERLSRTVKAYPQDAAIVIYCGCCPFVKCPNIRPAYRALQQAGFKNVKVLYLETNLHTNWIEKGYPTDKP